MSRPIRPFTVRKLHLTVCVIGMKTEVIGEWRFTVATDFFNVDLGEFDSVCTHLAPNRLQLLPEGSSGFDLGPNIQEFSVGLYEPNYSRVSFNGLT